eukprot:gb/GFBE01024238.1/.p1 GENE.gb/GFBE01024238.1/~~gb/GFBE01024238.1/.p1  ORF type:complete len:220 (+),score=46.52 gb/GFBE01024238.1/:1-660(+)
MTPGTASSLQLTRQSAVQPAMRRAALPRRIVLLALGALVASCLRCWLPVAGSRRSNSAAFVGAPRSALAERHVMLAAEGEGAAAPAAAAKESASEAFAAAAKAEGSSPAAAAATAPPSGAKQVGGIAEVPAAPEGGKRLRQFLALEPLENEVNQWEADMATDLTPEEERKKLIALATGSITFLLAGGYIILNLVMDNTDFTGFQGERTLSAEDLKMLGQ